MGNTPSAQASPARGQGKATSPHLSQNSPPQPTSANAANRPNLRLPLPQRPSHISPNSSNPASPSAGLSGRGTSPRRRKSLELPDLNKLSFTPAAPVPTLATHTSHHLAPTTAHGHFKRGSTGSAPNPDDGSPSRRWRMALGGRKSGLGGMTKIDSAPRTAPISAGIKDAEVNPYFAPSSPSDDRGRPRAVEPIAIPGRKVSPSPPPPGGTPTTTGTLPPPPTVAPSPPTFRHSDALAPTQEENDGVDGLVSVPVRWEGGGKQVHVICDFADNWKKRIKLAKTDTGFETILRVPPGQYRLKFLVDDSWRCSKNIPTATDHDGTLVNWLEVEPPKTEDESRAEWSMDSRPPAPKHEDIDDSQWSTVIPAPLYLYQYLEELPSTMTPEQWSQHYRDVPHLTSIPQPPVLPRVLEKVIVNPDSKRPLSDETIPGIATPAMADDNSILAIPNHVTLNHLTASAIKHGTLGVGTTTRYRKKFITTMYFKPTLQDLMEGNSTVPPEAPDKVPTEAS